MDGIRAALELTVITNIVHCRRAACGLSIGKDDVGARGVAALAGFSGLLRDTLTSLDDVSVSLKGGGGVGLQHAEVVVGQQVAEVELIVSFAL